MTPDSKIFVAGHRGMVGSAVVRALQNQGHTNLLVRTRQEVDLLDRHAVRAFFEKERPEFVVDAAARVGGIIANFEKPVEFLVENLTIQNNVIQAAADFGCAKLLFLGSSCIYPKLAPQPIPESAHLTGIKLCESYNRQYGASHGIDYRSVMPTNLYGPGDNYHPENSHVIPALLRRFHEAQVADQPQVTVWGSGSPRREFLYVDDMAEASVHVMNLPQHVYAQHTQPMLSHINVGWGDDVSIAELARAVAKAVGYAGQIVFDTTKPDGTPRKLMDSKRLNSLGWRARVALDEGLQRAYQDFLQTTPRSV